MTARHPSPDLPFLWLLSDARNDSGLERALALLPPGSGFVFRHYHLAPAARAARFAELAAQARRSGHRAIWSGTPAEAAMLGADGVYGSALRTGAPQSDLLRLATAHDRGELTAARRAQADGAFLSPVFPTRSHPGAVTLGAERFRALAQQADLPVIALGGMTAERARTLDWPRWGAIDGLTHSPNSA